MLVSDSRSPCPTRRVSRSAADHMSHSDIECLKRSKRSIYLALAVVVSEARSGGTSVNGELQFTGMDFQVLPLVFAHGLEGHC